MSEMVERVARAICTAYGDDFDDRPKDLDQEEIRMRHAAAALQE